MNIKKLLFAVLLLSIPFQINAVTVLFPSGGGTGTATAPTLGQVLVGQNNGTYAPQATSTLGITGGATPAGSSGDVQYNDSGSLGASSLFNWNSTNNFLNIGASTPNVARVNIISTSTVVTITPISELPTLTGYASEGSSYYNVGDVADYRYYSYKDVGATRYCSPTYGELQISYPAGGGSYGYLYVTSGAGADGTRILRSVNSGGFADGIDIGANANGAYVDDNNFGGGITWDTNINSCEPTSYDETQYGYPLSITGSSTYNFPAGDGTNNQVLGTNGSGILSWTNKTDVPLTLTNPNSTTTLTVIGRGDGGNGTYGNIAWREYSTGNLLGILGDGNGSDYGTFNLYGNSTLNGLGSKS